MEITSLLTAGSPNPDLLTSLEFFFPGASLDRLSLNQESPLETTGLPRQDDRLSMLRQLQWMEPLLDMLERLLGFGNTELPAPPPPAPPPAVAPPVTTGPVGEATPTPTTTPSGMKSGAPAGYKVMKGKIPSGVVAKAQSLLSQPMGSEHLFEVDGKRYFARLEHHYHPPGFQGGPNGWHKGCTVYQAG